MDTVLVVLLLVALIEAVVIAVLLRRTWKLEKREPTNRDMYCDNRIALELDCLERRINKVGRTRGVKKERK